MINTNKIKVLMFLVFVVIIQDGCKQKAVANRKAETRLDEIRIMLSWNPGPENAFLYYGIQQGFFNEEKIKIVEIMPSKGSSMVAQVLGNKKCDFGFISSDYIVQARHEGYGIKAIMALYHESPVTIYSTKDKGIDEPSKLIGKRVGVIKQSAAYPQYLGILKNAHIDADKIIEFQSTSSAREIINNVLDAAMDYTNYAPITLMANGYEVNEIRAKDYGIDIYGTCIAAHEDMVLNPKSKDLVQRFLNALIKSLEASRLKFNESIDCLIKAAPELDRNVQEKGLKKTNEMIFSAIASEYGVGYMDQKGWQRTQNTLLEIGRIDQPIDINYFYDSSFLKNYMSQKVKAK